MTYTLSFATYTIVYAALYSLLEIEIEGKYGWGRQLPTFTILTGPFKHFTFYHLIMATIIILTNTYPIIADSALRRPTDTLALCIYNNILWFSIEDFLWFVLNPYYTYKNYRSASAQWHSLRPFSGPMLGCIPVHSIITSAILLSCWWYTGMFVLIESIVVAVCFNSAVVVVAPHYHTFYLKQSRHTLDILYDYTSDGSDGSDGSDAE